MDWDLKTSTWDETTLPNIETMEEQESNRFGVYSMKGDFSVDLKLGRNTHHLTNSSYSTTTESSSSSLPMSKHAAASSSVSVSVSKMAPPPSSKKARAINNTTTFKVSCLVDGCNSDLSNCRDYHRRHKVCELHSKTPEVTISGLKQRFCQQCSRFHSLEQFDERKRSCRKRLDGHNRRRRKPQGEPLMRSAASFLSSYQGTQLLPFSSSSAMVNPVWNGGLVTSCAGNRLQIHNQHQNHQQVHGLEKQDIFLGSTATSYGGEGKQLAFLQSDNPTTATMNNQTPHLPITTSVCQTLLRTSPLSENCEVRNKMLLTSSSNSVQESPCALSLLSSSQTHTSSGNGGLNQMVQQPHSLSTLMQPLGLSLHGNRFESMVPNGSESDHCSSLYNMGSEGSQGNEAPQLFPYLHQWE